MSRRKKPNIIFTADTETRGMFGKMFRIGLYTGSDYVCGNTFTDIYDTIVKASAKFKVNVYFHNADFDTSKLIGSILDKENINFSKSIFINGKVCVLECEHFIIRDSYNILKSSLNDLSDSFGLTVTHKMDVSDYIIQRGWAVYYTDKDGKQKLDIKKSKEKFFMNVEEDDTVLNEYLKMDCISLFDILKKTIDISGLKQDDFIKCPTTPSLAMQVFKIEFPDDYKQMCSTFWGGEYGNFIESIVRASYCGGRTEVFKPLLENGYHYDLNSLYPYVMMTHEFPVGRYKHFVDFQADSIFQYWKKRGIGAGFLHCKVHVPDMYIPPLPYKAYGKLMFPVGDIEGVWTFPELKLAEEAGCTITKVIQAVYFPKTAPVFKDYIMKFKKIKENSKGALRLFAKFMLNTLYGKTGMKRIRNTFANIDDLEKIKHEGKKFFVHEFDKDGFNVKFIETVTEATGKYIQPQVASYVISLARIILYKGLIEQNQKGEVSYCDTDSIAGTAIMDEKMVDPKLFGKFKLESIVRKGIFLQPKFYCEDCSWTEDKPYGKINIKGKGIPHEILDQLKISDYERYLKIFQDKSQDRIEIFKDMEQLPKMMTSLKLNRSLNQKTFYSKCINVNLMQKRKINYITNTTSPHKINSENILNTEYSKVLREINKELISMDFDKSPIKALMEATPLKIPSKNDKLYVTYNNLEQNEKKKLFMRNGIPVEEFCKQYNLTEIDIVLEL